MSLLIEFLEAITNVMLGVEEGVRAGRIARVSDIEPFVRRLDESAAPQGMERCGEDAFCLGEAVLVYAVEPLLTPEGQGLAEVAVQQLDTHGATVERIEQPHENVLSVAGSVGGGLARGSDPGFKRMGIPDQRPVGARVWIPGRGPRSRDRRDRGSVTSEGDGRRSRRRSPPLPVRDATGSGRCPP